MCLYFLLLFLGLQGLTFVKESGFTEYLIAGLSLEARFLDL